MGALRVSEQTPAPVRPPAIAASWNVVHAYPTSRMVRQSADTTALAHPHLVLETTPP